MFISVDDKDESEVEGFTYTNQDGDTEMVVFDYDIVRIEDEHDCLTTIYVNDIPKLIKALQAAYNHKKGI